MEAPKIQYRKTTTSVTSLRFPPLLARGSARSHLHLSAMPTVVKELSPDSKELPSALLKSGRPAGSAQLVTREQHRTKQDLLPPDLAGLRLILQVQRAGTTVSRFRGPTPRFEPQEQRHFAGRTSAPALVYRPSPTWEDSPRSTAACKETPATSSRRSTFGLLRATHGDATPLGCCVRYLVPNPKGQKNAAHSSAAAEGQRQGSRGGREEGDRSKKARKEEMGTTEGKWELGPRNLSAAGKN